MLRKVFVHRGPIHAEAEAVHFSLFTTDEIKKISVARIVTPIAFSSIGHALPGGLYDPAMGPFSHKGNCTTCQQAFMYCPGHFGHIELPMPVMNPLFTKTLLSICRMSCLSCHSMLIPGPLKQFIIAQLDLLKHGLVKEAMNAEHILASFVGEQADSKGKIKMSIGTDGAIAQAKFTEYIDEILQDHQNEEIVQISTNMEALRNSIVKSAFKFGKMNQKCPFCGHSVKRMVLHESKIIYSDSTHIGKDDDLEYNDEDEEDDEENPSRPRSPKKKGLEANVKTNQKYLTPLEAREHLRQLWAKEFNFLAHVFPVLLGTSQEHPTDLLFVEIIPVPPPKHRPAQTMNGMTVEHPQNLALRQVISSCLMINYIVQGLRKGLDQLNIEQQRAIKGVEGATIKDKLERSWSELQADVDHIMDRDRSRMSKSSASQMLGIKQLIEKKEGLFRMNMMGKRVNYAARTVITPDPHIHIEEVGVPDAFALTLTFPQHVTPNNVNYLRKLIINGPNVHPGAISVENESGQVNRLSPTDIAQRTAIANRLLVPDKPNFKNAHLTPKIVYRHLSNGDSVLLNRQPSLHRPSIMAHRARVLKGEKVFRLHYANCKHYNADFDGDEMNMHFPQSHVARSEATSLVNVCSHFLIPKDGTPLAGLIQDHVVAAVKLTVRGKFFCRDDYQQLVYFALSNHTKWVELEPPTIIVPYTLWSGKQVISTIIKNLTPKGRAPINYNSSAKIKHEDWRQLLPRLCKVGGPIKPDDMSESSIIFIKGALLCGVLDKIQIGSTPYGLCHAFFELYGNAAVGALLTAFSRLFTNFLQWESFTLGLKDVMVRREANEIREELIMKSATIGPQAAANGVNLDDPDQTEEIELNLERVHKEGDIPGRMKVDSAYKAFLDDFTNKINKTCLPQGLVTVFPWNNLQLLVQSGAKGSTVNTMQMSCLLGQIELEGKRPAYNIAGRTLPSFKRYDTLPRAGGFISNRFITGVRPQEFFFHCMAGREGLIDTAVKTSRSGYLQRCLVKLLEGLVTQYDMTVRDSDGSVIQFLYGEDGLDVSKAQYLKEKQFPFLRQNAGNLVDPKILSKLDTETPGLAKHKKTLQKTRDFYCEKGFRSSGFLHFYNQVEQYCHAEGFNEDTGRSFKTEMIIGQWRDLPEKDKNKSIKKGSLNKLGTALSTFSAHSSFGCVSEALDRLIENEDKVLAKEIYCKAMGALVTPGDAVGVIAAQSIGEPSTQMTLNTFHFAGRGEMNVTLGIPRLREILMVASENIRTPSMDIPLRPSITEKKANKLRKLLTKVNLGQVLHRVKVEENRQRSGTSYALRFEFLHTEDFEDEFVVNSSDILKHFERVFVRDSLIPAVRNLSRQKRSPTVFNGKENKWGNGGFGGGGGDEEGEGEKENLFNKAAKSGMGEAHESSDEEEAAEDADATTAIRRARHTEAEYDEEENNEEANGSPQEEPDEEELDPNEIKYEGPRENRNKLQPEDEGYIKEMRIFDVIKLDPLISSYEYDEIHEEWCTITFRMPAFVERLNIQSMLRSVVEKSVIHQMPNISRAFIMRVKDQLNLKTEGINILEMAKMSSYFDLNKLYCNNIHTMAKTYGIEAAGKVIVKELTDVFKAYGITIDPRHLNLIADYMTFTGTYRPFNRVGIEGSPSPLQQMSFETVVSFLRDATLGGKTDDLQGPSARLILGKPSKLGTGLFSLHTNL